MSFKTIGYLFLIVAVFAAVAIFSYYSDINSPANKNGTPIKFTVTAGASVKMIGADLLKAGLIRSAFHFQVYVSLSKNSGNIQAGTYQLSGRMTIKEIVALLAAGKALNEEKEITIIPGWDLNDAAKYLAEQGVASSSAFYAIAGQPLKKYAAGKLPDYSAQFSVLADKPKTANLEGYLFPDTYRIYDNATAAEAIAKMIGNLDAKLTPKMRADIVAEGQTIYRIITLASIIEKEVRKTGEMKTVSGIFWNRLKIGQPLGSDATLSYVLGDNTAAHTLADTKINSPYNTYLFAGLPPGPICNPSLDAITAAIYPAQTDYYYFLTNPADGETVFAKTLDEQNRNKQKYLK
ncbi:MAG TPA: endolytic transglycosylase MltG [Candidatus Nanoarchaeia archaeon]|nr:endolytic transglycosylase MltG [Candidatus Nanoarchaeia archaeon]